MNRQIARFRSASRLISTLLAVIAVPLSSHVSATDLPSLAPRGEFLAQTTVPNGAPPPGPGASAALQSSSLTWTFAAPPSGGGGTWVAERGRLTFGSGAAQLQPDTNRRAVLLSPPGLPDAVRTAEEFVLGLSGTGLQRVRIQARRDARGGWITIADASGNALRETADGYVVKRKPGARGAPIERLRIEIDFRTTNPRTLQSIATR